MHLLRANDVGDAHVRAHRPPRVRLHRRGRNSEKSVSSPRFTGPKSWGTEFSEFLAGAISQDTLLYRFKTPLHGVYDVWRAGNRSVFTASVVYAAPAIGLLSCFLARLSLLYVCIYVRMYACYVIHAYIRMYIRIYIHIYIHTYIHIHMHIYM